MGRIISLPELKQKVKILKSEGRTIAFTNGCFDIIHPGHLKVIRDAKRGADILVVGINSDSSIKKIKGKTRPIMPESARAHIIASIEGVDFVTIFKEKTPLKLIKAIKPNILVKGSDWNNSNIVGSNIVRKYGGKIKIVKLLGSFSTTNIIRSVLKKYGCK